MSDPAVEHRRERRDAARRGQRRAALGWAARLLALALVFFLGLAVGRAVEEGPGPSGTQTLVRTLEPGTAGPAARTVTVTVTAR